MQRFASLLPFLLVGVALSAHAEGRIPAVSLWGSEASMRHQNGIARELQLPVARSPEDVSRMLGRGELVGLSGNSDYEIIAGFPFARAEVRTFVERLASAYRRATGEQLVVTSLVRPVSRQPSNAHVLSVHPAGIAIDLRVSSKRSSGQWLARTLLQMEREGLLDVTLERNPPHFHVALFPDAYLATLDEAPAGPAGNDELGTSGLTPIQSLTPVFLPPVPEARPTAGARVAASMPPFRQYDRMTLIALTPLLVMILAALRFRRRVRVNPIDATGGMPYVDTEGRIIDRRDVRKQSCYPCSPRYHVAIEK